MPTAYLIRALAMTSCRRPWRQKAREIFPAGQGKPRQSINAGVKIAFGTDVAVYPHGDNAREFADYVGSA